MATENTGTGINYRRVAFLATNGVPDVEATLNLIRTEMATYLAESAPNTPAIVEAVASVFNRMPASENKLMKLEELAIKALRSLTFDVASETKMLADIKSYIRAESNLFKSTNGDVGRYLIVNGAGGGVRLSTPSTVALYRAAQTKKTTLVVE